MLFNTHISMLLNLMTFLSNVDTKANNNAEEYYQILCVLILTL